MTLEDYVYELSDKLEKRFSLTGDELFEVLDYHYDSILYAWKDGFSVDDLIISLKNSEGKLTWKR